MKILLVSTLLALSLNVFSKAEKWIIDAAHTKIGFEVSHLIISSVEGKFKTFSGDLMFDVKDTNKSLKDFSFGVVIDSNSIDTSNDKRDKHLKSADFFDVKKKGHEKIIFKSTKVISTDGKKFKVAGSLKMAGKTKPVTIDFKYLGSADAYDVKRIAFKGSLVIKRKDFGLGWNDGEVSSTNAFGKVAEAAGAIGSEVEIEIKLEAKRSADL